MKHFLCRSCGNLVATVNFSGMPLGCCGERMSELTPSVDGSAEKHTPTIRREGKTVRVTVGTEKDAHPMLPEHSVVWVCLVTSRGSHRMELYQGEKPEAVFQLRPDEKVIRAFAYCNLHGLWVAEAEEECSSDGCPI